MRFWTNISEKSVFYQNYANWLTYDLKDYALFCGIFKNYTIFNKNDTSTADITEILDIHVDYYIWVDRVKNDKENDIYFVAYNYINDEKYVNKVYE